MSDLAYNCNIWQDIASIKLAYVCKWDITVKMWQQKYGILWIATVAKRKQMFWSNHSDQDRDAPIRLEIGNYLLSWTAYSSRNELTLSTIHCLTIQQAIWARSAGNTDGRHKLRKNRRCEKLHTVVNYLSNLPLGWGARFVAISEGRWCHMICGVGKRVGETCSLRLTCQPILPRADLCSDHSQTWQARTKNFGLHICQITI